MIKQVLLSCVLWLVTQGVVAQFKNIKLYEVTSAGSAADPSIVINPRNVKNIVAGIDADHIYYTNDGGQNWETTKITSSHGAFGNTFLVADDKGTIYSLLLSDPSGEGLNNEKSLDQILCHVSKDGGHVWEEASPFGSNASKDQMSPSATLDAKGNLIALWTQFDKYKGTDSTCQSAVFISGSSSGKKWSKPVQLSQIAGGCADDNNSLTGAMAAGGPDGKIFVVWAGHNKIRLDRSFDGGGMWLENDVQIINQTGGWDQKISGHSRSQALPSLMIDKSKGTYKGVLYLSWADQRSGEKDTDVWFMRSYNHGDNWSSPLKMGDDKNGKHQYMPSMTVDQVTGFIYIVYYDRSAYEDNQTDVFLAFSNDSGATFKSVKVSESPFTPTDDSPFTSRISIAAHNGIISPAWVRIDEGKRSVWTTVINEADLFPEKSGGDKSKSKKKK